MTCDFGPPSMNNEQKIKDINFRQSNYYDFENQVRGVFIAILICYPNDEVGLVT